MVEGQVGMFGQKAFLVSRTFLQVGVDGGGGDRLLSSLGENALSDIDSAWIAEAQRRYKEYKEGHRSGFDAQAVFAEADKIVE